MDNALVKQVIEGALLAAGQPLTIDRILNLFEGDVIDRKVVKAILAEISESCDERGFELVQVASGYRFQVKKSVGPWVIKLWNEKAPRYSRALLETLSLIAYRQPITRAEIEDVRGVSVSSNIIKTLLEREWVRVVGHRDVPGRPALYATTKGFLDYFELKRLDDLPTLAEIRDLDKINKELDLAEKTAQAEEEGEETDEQGLAPSDQTVDNGADSRVESHQEQSLEDLAIDFSDVDNVLSNFEESFKKGTQESTDVEVAEEVSAEAEIAEGSQPAEGSLQAKGSSQAEGSTQNDSPNTDIQEPNA